VCVQAPFLLKFACPQQVSGVWCIQCCEIWNCK